MSQKSADFAISVIVPVYNVEKYVEDCLKSVITQEIQGDMEIIVIDDVSTDNSLQVVRDKFEGVPNLQILQNDKNIGLGYTRNAGLRMARGEYIYFMDSDDILQAGALQTLYAAAKKYNADIVHSSAYYELEDEHLHWGTFAEVGIRHDDLYSPKPCRVNPDVVQRLNEGYIDYGYRCMVWLNLYRREFLLNKELFFLPTVHADNMYSLVCLAATGNIWCIPDMFYIYRQREGSTTHNNNLSYLKKLFTVMELGMDYLRDKLPSKAIDKERIDWQSLKKSYFMRILKNILDCYAQIDDVEQKETARAIIQKCFPQIRL